jgi:hypothetical protein
VAARRLLILLLVLLGISMLATALAPVRDDDEKTSSETTTTSTSTTETTATTATAPSEPATTGAVFARTIDANAKGIAVIHSLYVGDELQLTVTSKRPGQIAIPELGQIEAVSAYGPARFDLFLDEAGVYRIRLDADDLVGKIVVTPGARPEKGRKKANARP